MRMEAVTAAITVLMGQKQTLAWFESRGQRKTMLPSTLKRQT